MSVYVVAIDSTPADLELLAALASRQGGAQAQPVAVQALRFARGFLSKVDELDLDRPRIGLMIELDRTARRRPRPKRRIPPKAPAS